MLKFCNKNLINHHSLYTPYTTTMINYPQETEQLSEIHHEEETIK